MCGIVGYIGPKEACPILINGLKRLEYRGYDSAGIALIHIATGYHNAIAGLNDRIQILDTLFIFNLRDDFNIGTGYL